MSSLSEEPLSGPELRETRHSRRQDELTLFPLQNTVYLQQILVINLEARRKDYYQMFAHHIITSMLMMSSYVLNWTRIGNTILCTMDLVDITLPVRFRPASFSSARISSSAFIGN